MDARLLRAFIAVADCGSFRAAAQRILITQPALTKQIQALEAELGMPLFRRGRHGAEATPPGEALLPMARDVVRRMDALTHYAGRVKRGESGRLSIGFGLSSIDLAPRSVAIFRQQYPDVTVSLEDLPSSIQIESVTAGDLDVGFVRLPAPSNLGQMTLRTETLALAVANEVRAPSDAEQVAGWLTGRPVVQLAFEKGPGLVRQIERFYGAFDVRPDIIEEAHDVQTVLALVAARIGVALVPASALRISPPLIRIQPIEVESATWKMGVVWNKERLTRVGENFLKIVHAESAG
ncbi:LysR family transcriptional regulator [Streptomyces sp. NPDC093094]|uniref:LysR family transcriptional regulator n=1 Tax=Streptomyces sp. NPDC093094 TaxID=3366026 RepID=UPI0038249F83